ncbi:MAG: hypothetical protein HY918_02005 [Candidatus Doudnabacteria bacterium]|nr:hypothetical protein [Candidatus Doudnabacteria bacterium]
MPKTTSTGTKVAEGLGLAALAAAAAATYYFYGKDGKQHRKAVSAWSQKAKDEMVKKIKTMKNVSKSTYETAAKEVLAKYKQVKNISPKEVEELKKELTGHWQKIAKDLAKVGQAKAPVKKSVAKKAKK